MWAVLFVQRVEFLYDIAGVLVLNDTLITESTTLLSGWGFVDFLKKLLGIILKDRVPVRFCKHTWSKSHFLNIGAKKLCVDS